jgi:hypothetical protein
MNCGVCKHKGKCKAFAEESAYFESFENKPPENKRPVKEYQKLFFVTEEGAECGFFEIKGNEKVKCSDCENFYIDQNNNSMCGYADIVLNDDPDIYGSCKGFKSKKEAEVEN